MVEFKLTIDEAIEVLRNEVVYPLAQDNTEEGQMKNAKRDLALRMAIQALEDSKVLDYQYNVLDALEKRYEERIEALEKSLKLFVKGEVQLKEVQNDL